MPKGYGRPYDKFTRTSVLGASEYEGWKNRRRETGERSKTLNEIETLGRIVKSDSYTRARRDYRK